MSPAEQVTRLREQIERANNAYHVPSLRSEPAPSKGAHAVNGARVIVGNTDDETTSYQTVTMWTPQ
jgi:hypothetical protein